MFIQKLDHSSHCKSENRLAVWVILDFLFFWTVSLKAHACFLNIEWVQFVFVFVRDLYDKNNASLYCFTSDVMYKKCKRLVYTTPDLLARFCKVNLPNAKNSAWFVIQEFVFQLGLIYCTLGTRGFFSHATRSFVGRGRRHERRSFPRGSLFKTDEKPLAPRVNLVWSRAIMALKFDRRWLLFWGCTYEAINSM